MKKLIGMGTIAFALVGLFGADIKAVRADDALRAKNITLIVGNTAGGTYDLYARTIARHLGKYLPNNPTVIVQNMPGAASLLAASYTYSVAPQDGTVITALASTLPFQPLLDPSIEGRIDPRKVNWLPSPSAYGGVMTVRADSGISKIDDLRKRETTMSVISPGMISSVLAAVSNVTLGTKIKPINGLPDLPSSFLAIDRGEVDGYPILPYDSLRRVYLKKFKDGRYKALMQFADRRDPEFPDVPLASELMSGDSDKRLLSLATGPLRVGYAYMMGPAVPAAAVRSMREAFMNVFKDEAFLADAKSATLTIDPVPAEKVKSIVSDAYSAPKEVVQMLRDIYAGKKQ